MTESKTHGLVLILATLLLNTMVSLGVVLAAGRGPAPRPIQIALTPPAGLEAMAGPGAAGAAAGEKMDAEFEGYLDVWDQHNRPERLNWRWGYKRKH